MRPLLSAALELSLQQQMSLWDSVYLALAVEHDCPFMTADRRLFKGGARSHPAVRFLV